MTPTSEMLLRRANILQLAEPFMRQYLDERIDDVARDFDIVLRRFPHPGHGPDGVAVVATRPRPVAVDSLACSRPIRVWGGYARAEERIVLINTNSELPEREIWWHEFYHILFSPRQSDRVVFTFDATYEYRREERRADDFVAALLVPSLRGIHSIDEVVERFDVSKRIARHAVELHTALKQL